MFLSILALILVLIMMIAVTTSYWIFLFGDSPFVPMPMRAVHAVLKEAKIKKGAKVYDIGAGDGRLIHFATKDYQADATGIELDPSVYCLAKIRQKLWGWKGKVIQGNSMKEDLSDADYIFCYMMPKSLKKFQTKFQKELKKGCKIVSYAFAVGDLKPWKEIPKKPKTKISKILIYKI